MAHKDYQARVQLTIDGGTAFTEARKRGKATASALVTWARSKDLEGVTISREPSWEWRLGNPFKYWRKRAQKATVPLLVVFPVRVRARRGERKQRHSTVEHQLAAEAAKLKYVVDEPWVSVENHSEGGELNLGWPSRRKPPEESDV